MDKVDDEAPTALRLYPRDSMSKTLLAALSAKGFTCIVMSMEQGYSGGECTVKLRLFTRLEKGVAGKD